MRREGNTSRRTLPQKRGELRRPHPLKHLAETRKPPPLLRHIKLFSIAAARALPPAKHPPAAASAPPRCLHSATTSAAALPPALRQRRGAAHSANSGGGAQHKRRRAHFSAKLAAPARRRWLPPLARRARFAAQSLLLSGAAVAGATAPGASPAAHELVAAGAASQTERRRSLCRQNCRMPLRLTRGATPLSLRHFRASQKYLPVILYLCGVDTIADRALFWASAAGVGVRAGVASLGGGGLTHLPSIWRRYLLRLRWKANAAVSLGHILAFMNLDIKQPIQTTCISHRSLSWRRWIARCGTPATKAETLASLSGRLLPPSTRTSFAICICCRALSQAGIALRRAAL